MFSQGIVCCDFVDRKMREELVLAVQTLTDVIFCWFASGPIRF